MHDNWKIWEPCQIEVFQRLRSEFYPKSYARTTLFYIHWYKVWFYYNCKQTDIFSVDTIDSNRAYLFFIYGTNIYVLISDQQKDGLYYINQALS